MSICAFPFSGVCILIFTGHHQKSCGFASFWGCRAGGSTNKKKKLAPQLKESLSMETRRLVLEGPEAVLQLLKVPHACISSSRDWLYHLSVHL